MCIFNSNIGLMWIVMKEGALGSNAPSFFTVLNAVSIRHVFTNLDSEVIQNRGLHRGLFHQ